MKLLTIVLLSIFFTSGCGNLSPISRMNDEIENQEGKIQNLEKLQNSLSTRIGNIQNQSEVHAESIRSLQEGLINISHENSGFQMLTGSGGLIFAFATIVIFLMFFIIYYREKHLKEEKIINILSEEIVKLNDLDIENEIFSKAMAAGVKKEMLKPIKYYQKKFGINH